MKQNGSVNIIIVYLSSTINDRQIQYWK